MLVKYIHVFSTVDIPKCVTVRMFKFWSKPMVLHFCTSSAVGGNRSQALSERNISGLTPVFQVHYSFNTSCSILLETVKVKKSVTITMIIQQTLIPLISSSLSSFFLLCHRFGSSFQIHVATYKNAKRVRPVLQPISLQQHTR